MASADLYGAVTTFLDGDSGDARTAVNAEQAGLLGTNSVTVARAGDDQARQELPKPLTIEILPVSAPSRAVGIGWAEREIVVDLRITQERKDLSDGKAQLAVLAKVIRALVARYDHVSNLSIPVAGGLATFRYSRAELVSWDEIPESADLSRSVVRASFAFTEQEAANT